MRNAFLTEGTPSPATWVTECGTEGAADGAAEASGASWADGWLGFSLRGSATSSFLLLMGILQRVFDGR